MMQLIKQSILGTDLFNPAYYTAGEAHLDAVGMTGGFGENILNYPFGKNSTALIMFLYNQHCLSFPYL